MSIKSENFLKEIEERLRHDVGNVFLLRLYAGVLAYQGENEQAKKLNSSIEIAEKVGQIARCINVMEKNHKDAVDGLSREMSGAREKCTHMIIDYQPDASGNNDSTTTCLCCGKIL